MKLNWAVLALVLLATSLLVGHTMAADPHDEAIQHLLATGPDDAGVEKARKAVDPLVAAGTKALPAILVAIPNGDVVKANWLRDAFNRIVDDAIRENKPLQTDELLAVLKDKKKPGLARHLALDAVERVKPGTTAKLIDGGLDDPEFGADAVAARMNKAAAVEKADPTTAAKLYREAFDVARDFNQCFALAQRLKALDIAVDSLTRLGVVCDWMVLGPFDDPEEKGYAAAFAPEKGIGLKATYECPGGKIAWKRFTSDARDGWIDLVKVVGPRDAAVAYAYTVVTCPKDQEVELRASSDDNLAV